MQFSGLLAKRSVSSCDFHVGIAIQGLPQGKGFDCESCIAKPLQLAVCVWTDTKLGPHSEGLALDIKCWEPLASEPSPPSRNLWLWHPCHFQAPNQKMMTTSRRGGFVVRRVWHKSFLKTLDDSNRAIQITER